MKDKKALLSSRIKNDLLSIINRKGYKTDERLPAESEFASFLNVSRATLRMAFSELESQGIIKRIKGCGTFLLKPTQPIDLRIDNLFKLSDIMKKTDLCLKTASLKVESSKADANIAKRLAIRELEEVIIFERIRSIDDEPAVYSIDIVPKSILPPHYTIENMGDSLSEFLGVIISNSKATVTPLKATANVSEALKVAPDTLCLMLEEITYDVMGSPIDYSHEYYLSHMFNFKIERKRI